MENDGNLMRAPNAEGRRDLRNLIRGARSASLATSVGPQAYVALVTPACTAAMSLILLLSELSQHTRQLRENPLCSVLCVESGGTGNPQTWRRASLICAAQPDSDAALRARYLVVHPYAALYAGFGDFAIWRLEPIRCHAVTGFAQASSLDAGELAVAPALAAALSAAADDIVAHCNADHADAMQALGTSMAGRPGAWRLLGIDADGCDLGCAEASVRAAWTMPVSTSGDVRTALIALIAAARRSS